MVEAQAQIYFESLRKSIHNFIAYTWDPIDIWYPPQVFTHGSLQSQSWGVGHTHSCSWADAFAQNQDGMVFENYITIKPNLWNFQLLYINYGW